ncbi:MAG: DUF1800 domain-containing protein [Chloroflexota bacterium]
MQDNPVQDNALNNHNPPSFPSLNRRDMLRRIGAITATSSLGALAAKAMPVEAQNSAEQSTSGQMQVLPTMANAVEVEPLPELEVIAFNRMSFGPRPGDLEAFRSLGDTPDERHLAYVDQQLNSSSIDDSACEAILAQQGYMTLELNLSDTWTKYVLREGDENKQNDRYLPAKEVVRSAFLRAVYSKRQLDEVLADFWHNHFNVYAWNRWEGPTFRLYDRDAIRANMLGNFRQMLEAVAKSPTMLYYLDNQSNTGGEPNENYAREAFELHTMGAENYLGVLDPEQDADQIFDGNGLPIGYIDYWVYGATTCFSGWRVNSETGQFEFDESAHFDYPKLVLGATIPPFQGEKDGHDVLDLLVNHPGTARYVSRKLCRRFISDNPPEEVVQAAADVFYANRAAPDQLKKVVRTILLSDAFKITWGEKIKRPFEYVVSAMRGTNYDFDAEQQFFWRYDPAGQPLYSWPAPDGFPDMKESWLGTMSFLQRMRITNYLMEWTFPDEHPMAKQRRFRPGEQTPSSLKSPRALIDYWSNRILGRALPVEESDAIVEFMASGRNWDHDLPQDDIEERLAYAIALILMSSVFMLR